MEHKAGDKSEVLIDNSGMIPSWAKLVTTKTVKLPLSMTFTGKQAS